MRMVYIALQEFQTVALMLHRMAFHLAGKVVVLHLDNSIANDYVVKVVQYLLFFPDWPAA